MIVICKISTSGLVQLINAVFIFVVAFQYGHALLSNETGLNGCYASHIVLRRGTHVAKVPPQVSDMVASPLNCALATMVNAVGGLNNERIQSYRRRSALIQVN